MAELEGAQLQAAVSYNQSRGLDAATVEMIQRVVGVGVDGQLGPATTQAVHAWQASVGLTADGKIGPNTLAGLRRASEGSAAKDARLGVWIDDVPSRVLDAAYFDELEALGLDTIAIMVHRATTGSGPMWKPRWTTDLLERLANLAGPRDIDVVLTTWPLPNAEQLRTFARELPPLLAAAGAAGLEVDTEGNWMANRLDGFDDMDAAARALLDTLREAAAPTGARLELTTYPYHPENCPQAKLAPHMDRLFPQAYSVTPRDGKAVGWDDPFGPGGMQTLTATRSRTIPGVADGHPELGMGLAAYHQDFADHGVAAAMARALERARSLCVVEIRYWSSKWILGHMADGPVGAFFRAQARSAAESAADRGRPETGAERSQARQDPTPSRPPRAAVSYEVPRARPIPADKLRELERDDKLHCSMDLELLREHLASE